MTIEQKRQAIKQYCDSKKYCTCDQKHPCPLFHSNAFSDDYCWEEECPDDGIEYNFKLVSAMPDYKGPKEIEETPSAVNHPSHYNQGGIECWDAMEAAFGKEAVMTFCKLNAFKYVWRADSKNGLEDVNKAINYLNKYKELNADEAV